MYASLRGKSNDSHRRHRHTVTEGGPCLAHMALFLRYKQAAQRTPDLQSFASFGLDCKTEDKQQP